jgi:hypothetical protein
VLHLNRLRNAAPKSDLLQNQIRKSWEHQANVIFFSSLCTRTLRQQFAHGNALSMWLLILEIFAQNTKGIKYIHTFFFSQPVNYLSRAYWEIARLVGIWIKVSCVLSLYSWLKASFLLHDFNVFVVDTATKIFLCECTLELRMCLISTDFILWYVVVVLMHLICSLEILFHRWSSAARVKSSGEPPEKVRSPSATRLTNQLCRLV